jgi:hypothetical protein
MKEDKMTAIYVKNRREATLVAAIAREEFGVATSIRDIYRFDRYLVNIADRLFGADPAKVKFVLRARDEIRALRAGV